MEYRRRTLRVVFVRYARRATVAGVAAAAAECANPALLEPIALALWSASARCAEEGGTEASAWLGGVMVGALARG